MRLSQVRPAAVIIPDPVRFIWQSVHFMYSYSPALPDRCNCFTCNNHTVYWLEGAMYLQRLASASCDRLQESMSLRPEHSAPPEIFYNDSEARKYTQNSRIATIQVYLERLTCIQFLMQTMCASLPHSHRWYVRHATLCMVRSQQSGTM